jgi:hypothetical protein
MGSQVGPSPAVLEDTSPSQLDVLVTAQMGYIDQGADQTLIDLTFQHDRRPVKFVAGELMKCNDAPVKSFTGSFELELPTISIAGRQVKCLYRSGGQTASVSFELPPRLVILAPSSGQQIRRGTRTVVRFDGATAAELWVVALGPDAKAVAETIDVAKAMTTLDTSKVGAGDGSVTLTDPLDFDMPRVDGLEFRSIRATARRTTTIPVVWI